MAKSPKRTKAVCNPAAPTASFIPGNKSTAAKSPNADRDPYTIPTKSAPAVDRSTGQMKTTRVKNGGS